jgi:predicted alpha/beta superfamily hydrolase
MPQLQTYLTYPVIRFCMLWLIAGAAQCYAATPADKPSTAAPEVSLLKDLLDMPGLHRSRQIRLYLPPGYATGNRRYPVLYMHDGQNLFDDATAYAGEWHVDETLNALARSGKLELIVVGIDNGQGKRMTELNPWTSMNAEAPEGKQYMDFIVKVLKPLIDKQYRTKPDRANTAIMGSSMGGLISHYAILQYPEVFSKAGIFSPAYWTAPAGFAYFAAHPAAPDARLYFLAGEDEGADMVRDLKRVFASVSNLAKPSPNLLIKTVPGAKHNEGFWSSEFEQAVLWMFAGER